ncbi:hypothetical protein [Kribbella sp. NPDC055071]
MTARKLSISVPPEVEEMIKSAAAEEGVPVSTWIARAAVDKAERSAKHAAGRAAAAEMIAEYERESGPIPESARRRAREFMIEAGLLTDNQWLTAG